MGCARGLPLVLAALMAGCIGNTYGERSIADTLIGRTVYFAPPGEDPEAGFRQSWNADGTTRTEGPAMFDDKSGRWRVESGTYCEIFGQATKWRCWRITLSERGKVIRFWEIIDDVGDLVFFHRDLTGRFAD
jgi:hypothetical protein